MRVEDLHIKKKKKRTQKDANRLIKICSQELQLLIGTCNKYKLKNDTE